MFIARVLYPVKVLGPGNRIGIWFAGCPHHCSGCSNPELWEQSKQFETSTESVVNLIRFIFAQRPVDGFTITGGDPFFQAEALHELLKELAAFSQDILVYTGYLYEDICRKYPDTLKEIAVLIDGPYVETRNQGLLLRGSDNQRILILNETYKGKYENYLNTAKSEIQNFSTRNGTVSVGIHLPDYESKLKIITKKMGLETE